MALRVIGVVCFLAGLAFLGGCRTYLVSGGFPSETESKTVRKRYQIESLKLPDGLISKEDAGLSTDDVRQGIMNHRSDIFDQHVDAVPIAIEVVKLNAKERPAYREFLCQVNVRPLSGRIPASHGGTFTYRDDISVFGHVVPQDVAIRRLGYFDAVGNANELGNEKRRKDVCDVLVEVISRAIIIGLGEMEYIECNTKEPSHVKLELSSQIQKLKALRDAGTITEQEYQNMVLRAVEKGK